MENNLEIPADFTPLFRTSPFLDTLGPFYNKRENGHLIVGIQVLEKHINNRGFAHAGLYMTLADIAIGYAAAFSQDPPLNLVTVNHSTDFVGNAKLGDWLECHVDIQKIGKQVAFANAFIWRGEERIVRVSTVFSVIGDKPLASK
jgi:acyl-coenzyme A thioesterase 13